MRNARFERLLSDAGIALDRDLQGLGEWVLEVANVRIASRDKHMITWDWQRLPRGGDVLEWMKSRPRANPEGILDSFLALTDATPFQVLRFIQRYGPLEYCRHGSKLSHCDHHAKPQSAEAYRTWSRVAEATLNLAASLYSGRASDTHAWEELAGFDADVADIHTYYGGRKSRVVTSQVVTDQVNWWLDVGGSHQLFSWYPPDRPTIGWRDDQHVFGAIARQMAHAIVRAPMLATCAECGSVFPTKRRPAAGRRSWCPSCGKKAADRQAQRDRRAKKTTKPRKKTTRRRTKK